MNLRALRIKDITPHILLQSIHKDVNQFETMYVVAFDKEGEPITYTAGDLNTLAYASLILHDLATMHLHGNIVQE